MSKKIVCHLNRVSIDKKVTEINPGYFVTFQMELNSIKKIMKKFGSPQKTSTGGISENEIIVRLLNDAEEMYEFMVRKHNETIFAL